MADKCPSCNAPVDEGGKFQDLPPSKYPRSYSPQFGAKLQLDGARSPGGAGYVKIDNGLAGQSARDSVANTDQNTQAGERSLGQKMLRGAAQRAKK